MAPISDSTKPTEVDPIKKRNQEFKSRIDESKSFKKKLIPQWDINIDYRRGKPFTSASDDDQVAVNLDWTYTKEKHAALYSQTPQARIDHAPDTLPKGAPWVPTFERYLNDKLIESGIEACMEEVIPDCINASGFGAAIIAYETIAEEKSVPKQDTKMLPKELQDEIQSKGTMGGVKIPMDTVPQSHDYRYTISRISPSDLLWPAKFNGSDFNRAAWLGHSGRITWAEAVLRFGLKEEDKIAIVGDPRRPDEKLANDAEKESHTCEEMVDFDELFYREFQFDPDAKSFRTIHHLVFVTGKDDPVKDEPWKGQKVDADGKILGSTRYPIQVLTLTYLTDEAIPPSDSAISRPQVNELNKGRTQQVKQRERSLPVRWFDVNRIDPAVQQGLMRGTWQAMIPVQGDGSRVIGEVARATMPTENFVFDKVAKADYQEQWGMGQASHDANNPDEKEDQNQNKSAFNTRLGKERARVGTFFCGIAEILGCLMCLFEDPTTMGEGFDPNVSKILKFSILTDSTVLLDAGQKLSRLNQFVDTYAKSGWINVEPVLQEIATLVGLDPTVVVQAPSPKPPVEPNISLRLTGVEDMLNPLTLAFLIKSGQAPAPDLIEQAKQLIQQSVVPPTSPGTIDPSQGPGPALPDPTGQAPPPGSPTMTPPPPKLGEANPQWTTMAKLGKRTEGGQG